MTKTMLTTVDNPHSPFDDFLAWYTFDVASGYHTSAYLASHLHYSDDLSEADLDFIIEQTIDEIVEENVLGIYRKVTQDVVEV